MDFLKRPLKVLLIRLSIGLFIIMAIGITFARKIYNPKDDSIISLPVTQRSPDSVSVTANERLPEVASTQTPQSLRIQQPIQHEPDRKNVNSHRVTTTDTITTTYTTKKVTSIDTNISVSAYASTSSGMVWTGANTK